MTLNNDIRLLPNYEMALLLPLVHSFYDEGNLPGKVNDDHFVSSLKNHVNTGLAFILVGGMPIRGMISGIMFNDIATGEPCCQELFWYVNANERGTLGMRLFDSWEKEAKRRGAKNLMMVHLNTEKNDKFKAMYEHRGYKMREQMFMKEG